MELVNLIYSKNNVVSEPIKGQALLEEWTQLFTDSGFYNDGGNEHEHDQKVAGKLNMEHSSKGYEKLKSEFCVENLLCDGVILQDQKYILLDASNKEDQQSQKQNDELVCYRMQRREMEKWKKDSCSKKTAVAHFRYVFSPEQSSLLPATSTTPVTERKVSQQTLYIIQIYRPVSSEEKFTFRKFQNMPRRLDHVIAILGSQPLTALRDKIVCCSDHIILGEYSDNPSLISSGRKAKFVFMSAFFYIGGTFYNDLRYKECVDYSRDLIKLKEDLSHPVSQFHCRRMDEVKFEDIDFKLGYPYLYLHQGNCEHVIVVSDIRLLDPSESHQLNQYPMICRDVKRHRLVCMICETFTAKWMTTGNKRLSYDPYFFCDICFHSFNYTVEGKVGDFKAYCYVDRTAI